MVKLSTLNPTSLGVTSKPKLVIDVEDTLVEQKKHTLAELNRRYKTDVTIDQVDSFKVQEVYMKLHGIEIGRPEIIEIHRELWANGKEMTLLDAALPERFQRIRQHFSVNIVTASVADTDVISSFLLSRGIGYDGLLRVDSSEEKIRLNQDAVACVDDHTTVVMDFALNGKVGIIVSANWNSDAMQTPDVKNAGGRVIRARDWAEIEDHIVDLAVLYHSR